LSRKSEAEQSKNGQVNAFNRGGLDVIILNAAGSTGISLHADRRFKDQRKRKMFMVQPSLDINQVMQMFGRILRSGQVVKPSYEILSLDLPAERRPTMVLAKKMRSLNANTSANAKGNVDLGVDFLNKYGDDVALEYLQNHSDIQQKTGIEILTNAEGEPIGETEDLMKKLLGKGALLSNAEQEDMYRELEDAYRDYTEELKARGDYDLEMEVHEDWDVKILEERQALPGNGNGGLFGQPVNLKTVDMREKVSVPSLDEYTKEIKNNGLEDRAAALKKAEDLCRPIEDAIRRIDATVWPGKESDFIRERQYANQKRLNEFREWVRQFHNQPLTITVGENTYQGALSDIRVNKPDPKNPAMGSIVLRFAIGDSIGHLRVPYRSIATGRVGVYLSSKSLDEIFTGQKQTIRVQRQVMTGNLAGAYEMMLAQQAAG